MSQTLQTVRVIATDPASQGPFVVMNAADFNPEIHKLYGVEEPKEEEKPRRGRPPKLKDQEAQNGNR